MSRSAHLYFCCLLMTLPAGATDRPANELARSSLQLTRPSLQLAEELSHTLAWHRQPFTARSDTVYLLGGPGRLDGKFEDAAGQPHWQGWTSEDHSFVSGQYWSVTDEPDLVIAGSYSLWCGTEYPEPGPIPVPGFGYGNYWDQLAVYTHTVADPSVASNVVWALKLQHDSEPGYDFTYLQWNRGGQWITLSSHDGDSAHLAVPPNTFIEVSHAFTVGCGQYAGPSGDQIQLGIRFVSDFIWSDEDGNWPTERGACQVDDITVTVNGVLVDAEDFESGTLGSWQQVPQPGVGDFAALYTHLGDLDPCASNWSPQVAFIDDGVVVPGTGGTTCITWCYGPGGYIVNNTGGLMGNDYYIHNGVTSPVLTWPSEPACDQAFLTFDVYRHELLGQVNVWPGVFYQYWARSVDTGDPADLELAPWQNHYWWHYGGPDYLRALVDISGLLAPARTHLQVSLRVIDMSWIWQWHGVDGTPAPYFDNVAVMATSRGGPAIGGSHIHFAQDNFPSNEMLDFVDLANNAVRFDAADGRGGYPDNVPRDYLLVTVKAVQAGSVLADRPQMHVAMKTNPLFDPVRALPPGFTHTPDAAPDGWGVITGWVYGDTTYNAQGQVVADLFNFDLPDDDFFYPGDVIHYYFEAEDSFGAVRTLPGDLQGFGDFARGARYSRAFAVHALPTMFSAVPGDQPRVLFWNDSGFWNEDRWVNALHNLGYHQGLGYDTYSTNGPSTVVGNGLGGRATVFHLEYYDVLLYSSGHAASATLTNSDNSDPNSPSMNSNDLGLVSAWLEGGKSAFLTGDSLLHDLTQNAGAEGQAFVNDHFHVSYQTNNLRPFINNQVAPLVRTATGNGVIERVAQWIAYGGCPDIRSFDGYTVMAPAQRLAEFTDHHGQPGAYPYAAASLYVNPTSGATVILMPYDFITVMNAAGFVPPPDYAGMPARAILLEDILTSLGVLANGSPLTVPAALEFAVSNHPNPFNPTTTVRLSLPSSGPVSVKVYSLRGELVQTLVGGELTAGVHDLVWDGTTRGGGPAPSGVYFCEARHEGKVRIQKLALVR
jgi:hypothetical protein